MLARLLPITVFALSLWGLPARAGPDRIARYSLEAAQEEIQPLSVIPESSYVQLAGGLTVQNVFLADRSRVVYNTNAPIESGAATIVYLTPIEPLDFPGLLTATSPRLQITAADPQGTLRVFTVSLVLGAGHPTRAIINDPSAPQTVAADAQYIQTMFGQASVHDLEAGLKAAIAGGTVLTTSETAQRIRDFIALWRNGDPLKAAQEKTQLSWGALVRLAANGQIERAKQRRDRFERENNAAASGESNPDGDRAVVPLLPEEMP